MPKVRRHAWLATPAKPTTGCLCVFRTPLVSQDGAGSCNSAFTSLGRVGLRQRDSMANASIPSVAIQAGLDEFDAARRYATEQCWLVKAGKAFSTMLTPAGWRAARGNRVCPLIPGATTRSCRSWHGFNLLIGVPSAVGHVVATPDGVLALALHPGCHERYAPASKAAKSEAISSVQRLWFRGGIRRGR